MKLVLISPENQFEDEHAIVNRWAEEHEFWFHIRKPGWDKEKLDKYIELLSPTVKEKSVVHSNAYFGPMLVKEWGLKGWHGAESKHSQSVHNQAELLEAGTCEYVLCSPLFDSISKDEYEANETLSHMPDRNPNKIPLIALGGITGEKVFICKRWRFSGVAAFGAVWKEESKVGREKAFISLVKACKR
jgi:hypothetical protein